VISRDRLVADLARLGVRTGDALMVHASLRSLGPVEGGPDAVLAALDGAVGESGTLLMVLGAAGVPEWSREPTPAGIAEALAAGRPFAAGRTPADPEVGYLAERFRLRSGTRVTDHPLGRFGARGARAAQLLADAPWDDYYGPGSPLDRLREVGGRVLRLGADRDTVTLLHLAEYLVPLERKRRVRKHVLVDSPGGALVRPVEALDDSAGIVDWPGEDYFALLLTDYLAGGLGRSGRVGNAPSELIDARDLLDFAVRWMKLHLEGRPTE
jgi:aminoglycoside N3'-acetyltransferase